MFLSDQQRTSRSRRAFEVNEPRIKWVIDIPSVIPYGPESTPIEDDDGRYYFGCHDGNVYCANPENGIVWSIFATKKVYSSPAWVDSNRFVVAAGNGYLLCINKGGKLLWKYQISKRNKDSRIMNALWLYSQIPLTFDFSMKKFQLLKCWSSPLVIDGLVFISGFGEGLHAVDVDTGKCVWVHKMGWPAFHRSGVAMSKEGNIFVASQYGRSWMLTKSGEVIWVNTDAPLFHESWSNPSIDENHGLVFFVWSLANVTSLILAIDFFGNVRWKTRIPSGVRGAVAIGYENSLYLGSLSGCLYAINKATGKIINYKKIANSNRGLWTTPLVLPCGNLLITTKDSISSGAIKKFDSSLNEIWSIRIGKALMVPYINSSNEAVVGSWDGRVYGIG